MIPKDFEEFELHIMIRNDMLNDTVLLKGIEWCLMTPKEI